MNTDTPLIYTNKGNIPESSLVYSHGWEDSLNSLVFWEQYTLDGEVVKRAAHVYMKQGALAEGALGTFG